LSNIRVTYSGLISFAISLTSVLTGLIFTIVVTRRLSQEEFGTWALIGGLITYVLVIEPIISYWTTREIARGVESGTTSLVSSSIFSIFGLIGYLIIAFFVGQKVGINLDFLYFAALLVPVIFLTKTLNAINAGWKPHSISFGYLAFELTKIPAAFLLIYFLDLGLIGAISATIIAHIANIIVLFWYAKSKLKESFKIKTLKKWLNLSWLPLYPALNQLLLALDVAIYSTITGSVFGLAFWAVGNSIANFVGQSDHISKGLYPKLLESGKSEFIQENLLLSFYFAIPLMIVAITFAKPGLFILNPLYISAVPIVIILSFKVFLDMFFGVYFYAMLGLEKVDLKNSTFKEYLKSKLFFLPTIRLIQFSSYIALLTIMLLVTKIEDELTLVIYWALISLGTEILSVLYMHKIAKKEIMLKINWNIVMKYFVVSIVTSGIAYVLMNKFLIYDESVYVFLLNLIPYLIISLFGYLGITYCIDKRTRRLLSSIINELLQKS
jgi:hypothetical protein